MATSGLLWASGIDGFDLVPLDAGLWRTDRSMILAPIYCSLEPPPAERGRSEALDHADLDFLFPGPRRSLPSPAPRLRQTLQNEKACSYAPRHGIASLALFFVHCRLS